MGYIVIFKRLAGIPNVAAQLTCAADGTYFNKKLRDKYYSAIKTGNAGGESMTTHF